jgi:hypothetical protein
MRRSLFVACVCCFIGPAIGVAGGQGEGPAFVKLTPNSELTHEPCLPPCLCPGGPATGPMVGGMVLVAEVQDPPVYFRFRVEQVHWVGDTPRGRIELVGTGIYEQLGDFVLQERLQLDLSPNGEALQHFDTGIVFGGEKLVAEGPQVGCTQNTISVRWEARCPADYNADGSLNPDDLADFITGFFLTPRDPRSDFNLDGQIDPDDLADFITAFFLGVQLGCEV